MKTKTVTQLDSDGFFVGVTNADESPLEPGVFLIPAGAIDREPPKNIDPAKRYRPWGTGWRGEDRPPSPETPKKKERTPQEIRREQIRARLDETVADSVEALRAVTVAIAKGNQAPADQLAKVEALHSEVAALREEMGRMV